MTYIELINRFWSIHDSVTFSANEIAIYFALLREANRRSWPSPFVCPNRLMCMGLGISESTFIRCRDRLVGCGVLSFKPGKDKRKAPIYYFQNASSGESSDASSRASSRESSDASSRASIYKTKDKRLKKKEKNKPSGEGLQKQALARGFFNFEDFSFDDFASFVSNTCGATVEDLHAFYDHYAARGWQIAPGIMMVDVNAAFRSWMSKNDQFDSPIRRKKREEAKLRQQIEREKEIERQRREAEDRAFVRPTPEQIQSIIDKGFASMRNAPSNITPDNVHEILPRFLKDKPQNDTTNSSTS